MKNLSVAILFYNVNQCQCKHNNYQQLTSNKYCVLHNLCKTFPDSRTIQVLLAHHMTIQGWKFWGHCISYTIYKLLQRFVHNTYVKFCWKSNTKYYIKLEHNKCEIKQDTSLNLLLRAIDLDISATNDEGFLSQISKYASVPSSKALRLNSLTAQHEPVAYIPQCQTYAVRYV